VNTILALSTFGFSILSDFMCFASHASQISERVSLDESQNGGSVEDSPISSFTVRGCPPLHVCNMIAHAQLASLTLMLMFAVLSAFDCFFIVTTAGRCCQESGKSAIGNALGPLRPLLMLGGGIITLGTSGSLGIAAGAIEMVAAILWVVLTVLTGAISASEEESAGDSGKEDDREAQKEDIQ